MKFMEKNKGLILWAALPVLFGILATSFLFSFLREGFAREPQKNVLSAELAAPVAEKPKYFYINKSEGAQPKISAEAFLVGDLATGK